MKNQVCIHPLLFAAIVALSGVAGASLYSFSSPQFEPADPIPSECPPYRPVGTEIDEATAQAYYTDFVEQKGEDTVRYITLSLDVLNDMNVVKQNADESGIDINMLKLYYGMSAVYAEPFLMICGTTGSGNLITPFYQLRPNREIGPCPYDCDAGGLPPTH